MIKTAREAEFRNSALGIDTAQHRRLPVGRALIRSLAVDTHGHTHFGSGLAKLLGFDLYTRWHDMRSQWVHVPRDWPPEPGLEPVLMRDLDPEFIQS